MTTSIKEMRDWLEDEIADDVTWIQNNKNLRLTGAERREKRLVMFRAILSALDGPSEIRPKIVCFCGSSRFIDTFGIFMWEYEKAGNIALGLHWIPPSYRDELNKPAADDHQAEAEGIAEKMDELHLRKIDLADEIFILNVGGYIGESTRKEIEYAAKLGKRIKYLEPVGNPAPEDKE